MKLSKQKAKFIRAYFYTAARILAKREILEDALVTTRIAIEVLQKHHFKVKPLVTEVKIYNDAYVKKGRNPSSEEEFKEWIEEGAWAIVVPEHVVAVVNEKTMIDLSINQAERPNEDIVIPPVVCDFHEEFGMGEKPLFVENVGVFMVYDAQPLNEEYKKEKNWFDTEALDGIISDINSEMRALMKEWK